MSTEINKVSLSDMYNLLNMRDLNNNNVIEKGVKQSMGCLSSIDEGYKEEADIDKDGKIVVYEAKFFLHGLRDVSDDLKNQFALDKQETQALYEAFKNSAPYKFAHPSQKAKNLSFFAKKLFERGGGELIVRTIFKEALKIAEEAKKQNETEGLYTITTILNDMFWGGLNVEALQEAQRLQIDFTPNILRSR